MLQCGFHIAPFLHSAQATKEAAAVFAGYCSSTWSTRTKLSQADEADGLPAGFSFQSTEPACLYERVAEFHITNREDPAKQNAPPSNEVVGRQVEQPSPEVCS